MFFNSKIEGQTATAAWGTAVSKQTNPCFIYEDAEFSNIFSGMLYCSKTDKEHLDIKGMSSNRELMMFSVFDKILVNGKEVKDSSFILLLVKEHSSSHEGRMLLSYPMYAKYTLPDKKVISNEETKNRIAEVLGCSTNGCWFVSEISIGNQDTLLINAHIVDKDNPKVYKGSSKQRSAEWQKIVLESRNISNEEVIKSLSKNSRLPLPLQQIFYGAPGTGKSFYVDDVCKKYKHYRTTFHPDSDYSTFVGCYKPTMEKGVRQYTVKELISKLTEIKNTGTSYPCHKFAAKYWESLKDLSALEVKSILSACEFTESMNVEISKGISIGQYMSKGVGAKRIAYSFVPQTFVNAYIEAWSDLSKPVFLVVEEINRGNCAQIFGDLFQLLDRNEDGYSSYEIEPNTDLKNYIANQGLEISEVLDNDDNDISEQLMSGELMVLPPNLHIWATMNTSDQSLFPIDSAFKRRWDWKYMPINTEAKSGWMIEVNGRYYSWSVFLEKINVEIEDTTSSEDKQLGFFFCKADDTDNNGNNGVITAERFVSKVLFYLYTDVFKDYGFEREFFKDKDNNNKLITFRSLFKENGNINEDRVEMLLKNLDVKLASEIAKANDDGYVDEVEDENTGLEEDDENDNGVSDTNAPYKVTFPDGEVICEEYGWDTYIATLRKIGLDKALPYGQIFTRMNKTLPLITDKKIQDQGTYKYIKIDGYYVLSGTDSQHRLLRRMNKDLNLGLIIE